jgi:(p)ppGpp synthase/HD superfamily hydrolase
MIDQENFFRAYYFARQAHGDQLRIGGEKYINHPFRVAKRTEEFFPDNEPIVLAAMLHDVLEDTDVNSDWMRDQFGFIVTKYVKYLTKTPATEGINREKRHLMDLNTISHAPAPIESVKLIDRIDNLHTADLFKRGFLKVYYRESIQMLDILKRAKEELREELYETLMRINENHKLERKK